MRKELIAIKGEGGFQEWETSDKGKLREANYIEKGKFMRRKER